VSKHLRIIVPAVQAAIALVVAVLHRFVHTERIYDLYVGPAFGVVARLNFPFFVFLRALDWLLPRSSSLHGAAFAVATSFFAAMLIFVFLLFWYAVVREIEMRRQGTSMLRFSSWGSELLAVVVLLCFGIGAISFAYSDVTRLLSFHQNTSSAILGGLFLLMWGAAFIGTALYDLAAFLKGKSEHTAKEEPL